MLRKLYMRQCNNSKTLANVTRKDLAYKNPRALILKRSLLQCVVSVEDKND